MLKRKSDHLVAVKVLDDDGYTIMSKDIAILAFTVIDEEKVRQAVKYQFNLAYDCLKLKSQEHFEYQLLRAIDYLCLFNRQYMPV
jgi:hypothetical protein